jgi:hypothetical protein
MTEGLDCNFFLLSDAFTCAALSERGAAAPVMAALGRSFQFCACSVWRR